MGLIAGWHEAPIIGVTGLQLRPFTHILRPFDLAVREKSVNGRIDASCTFYITPNVLFFYDLVKQ